MKTTLPHFPRSSQRLGFWLITLFLVFAGIFTRFSALSTPLLDFHPTRQLFGAIKARGYFIQQATNVPDWQKEIARRQLQTEAVIEPPILELVSASLYRQFGELTAFPRAVSATFWLLGAIFLYKLTKDITGSRFGSLAGVGVYLLLPFSINASRSFQPEALMIFLMLAYWWAFERWCSKEGWKFAALAGLFGGLSIFVKFTSVFFIVPVSIGFLVAANKFTHAYKKPQFWLIQFLGVVPAGIYFYYGYFVDPFLKSQLGGRFFVEKWIDPYFYLRWLMAADNVIPISLAALGILGGFMLAEKKARQINLSMLLAYILFGFTFAHHISSHDYYSLPLIPIVAIWTSQFVTGLLPALDIDNDLQKSIRTETVALICFAILLAGLVQVVELRTNNYQTELATWEEIGQVIGHQPGLISLTTDYGYPLEYYGWQNTELWPASIDYKNIEKEFVLRAKGKSYFLITDFKELANQPDLLVYLQARFPVIAEKNTYILFDLTKHIK